MSSRKRVSRSKSHAQKSKAKKKSRSQSKSRSSTSTQKKKPAPIRKTSYRKRAPVQQSRSAPRYLKTPANWYLKKSTGEPTSAAEKANFLQYFKEGLPKASELYAGFTKGEGYDLKRLPFWPPERYHAARMAVSETNHLYSTGYGSFIAVKPRTPQERAALEVYTGQHFEVPGHPQQRFLVPANVSKRSLGRVRYIKESVPLGFGVTQERLRAEVVTGVKGGRLMTRRYLFSEILGFQPGVESAGPLGLTQGQRLGTFDPWEQMKIAMREFERRLPQRVRSGKFKGEIAHYQMLTDRGPVGSPMEADMLVANMERWGEEYATHAGFAANLIGVLYRGSQWNADRKYILQETKRQRYQRERREFYKQMAKERHHQASMVDQFGQRWRVNKKGRLEKVPDTLFSKSKRGKSARRKK